jgi:hypothetical protein
MAMQLLDQYLDLQEQIYAYFGYVEDWKVMPIEDARKYYWALSPEQTNVYYCESRENAEELVGNEFDWEVSDIDGNDVYSDEIISPFLPKGIYRGKDYTMVVVDTHTDGNKFLQIFDNAKEIADA